MELVRKVHILNKSSQSITLHELNRLTVEEKDANISCKNTESKSKESECPVDSKNLYYLVFNIWILTKEWSGLAVIPNTLLIVISNPKQKGLLN